MPKYLESVITYYKKLGLKAGLECHQQLDTHKLFCQCPSILRTDKPNIIIKRELRPMAGELGKIDIAALHEKLKGTHYIYESYSDTTCLVELDAEPPHEINPEALEIALLVAKMLHCEVPPVLQVMRKTVIDGSNTSGFQRTVLVGINGWLQTDKVKVGITNVCLEEDAARRIREDKESVTFRLDRLGVPLIEIGTAPDIKTPEQGLELAKRIGNLLRATGKAMRGIGTIRQDLNVSIKGGARVEIKGVQELQQIPKLIEREVERQLGLIRSKKEVEREVRNALPDGSTKFLRPMPGAARMYPETDLSLIPISKESLAKLKLPELLEAKAARFIKLGLSADLAKQMVRWPEVDFFEDLIKKFKKVKPSVIASNLFSISSEVKRKTSKEFSFSDEQFEQVFELLNQEQIVKEALLDVFIGIFKGESIEKLAKKFKKLSDAELKGEIEKIVKTSKVPPEKLAGVVISKLRGKAEVGKILKLLKKN